jgi:hypothetical protein
VDRLRNVDRTRSTCLAAIMLAIVGVFGTWSSDAYVSLNGVEGSHNGWLVILFALMALCGVGSLARRGWLGVACVLEAGSIMLYTAISDLLDDRSVHAGSSGWGICLTIVMSGVLVAAAIVGAVERLRGNTPAGARASSSSGS